MRAFSAFQITFFYALLQFIIMLLLFYKSQEEWAQYTIFALVLLFLGSFCYICQCVYNSLGEE